MSAKYVIERWSHGWVICSVYPNTGIPMIAMSECLSLCPEGSVIDSGIAHHLRETYMSTGGRNVVMCVGQPNDLSAWRKEINSDLDKLDPQSKWWRGLDVGTSSASIFAVFCDDGWKYAAGEIGKGSTPSDADDFGRCKRLLDTFPEWRKNLHKVPEAYPDTKWGKIIERWDALEKAEPKQQTEILRSII